MYESEPSGWRVKCLDRVEGQWSLSYREIIRVPSSWLYSPSIRSYVHNYHVYSCTYCRSSKSTESTVLKRCTDWRNSCALDTFVLAQWIGGTVSVAMSVLPVCPSPLNSVRVLRLAKSERIYSFPVIARSVGYHSCLCLGTKRCVPRYVMTILIEQRVGGIADCHTIVMRRAIRWRFCFEYTRLLV